jgi:hypothetical protein
MDVLSRYECNGILNTGVNVFWRGVRIVVSDYFVKTQALVEQLKYALDGDSSTSNTGLTEMDIGVNADSVDHIFSPQC